MPDLKSQIYYFLKKHHQGKDKAITVRELTNEFRLLRASERDIRRSLRELDLEGKPILTSVNSPVGVYYAIAQSEVEEYRSNLVSRLTALKERIEAVERMRLGPEQMKLFR